MSTNPHIDMLLIRLELRGAQMHPVGKEGPRRVGNCVYCAGQCQGVTNQCEQRVWEEGANAGSGWSRWARPRP